MKIDDVKFQKHFLPSRSASGLIFSAIALTILARKLALACSSFSSELVLFVFVLLLLFEG